MIIDYSQIKSKLSQARHIVITSHQSPDGDAAASSLAIYNFLKAINISSKVILPDAFASFYAWMSGSSEVLFYDKQKDVCDTIFTEADVIFCLDYNDSKRLGTMKNALDNSKAFKILIDHHPNPSQNFDVIYSDTSISSTCEMVFEFISNLGHQNVIDKTIGECIYCGMMTDTGSFRFSSVTPRTHEVVAMLINKGVKHYRIHEAVYDQNSLDRIKLQGHILNNQLEYLANKKSTIIHLTKEDHKTFNIQAGDTEGFVNIALSIKGTEIAAFFREKNDMIKISFRSKGSIEANKLAEKYFSGGGHKNAAGGEFNGTLNDAISLYKKVIDEFI